MNWNGIGAEGAASIANGLKKLNTLDVSWNNIGAAGAASIADGLQQLYTFDY